MPKFLHSALLKINAILLAAGLSDRMQGPNKLLLDINGESVISRTYNALIASEVGEVVVVTGRDESAIRGVISLDTRGRFAYNEFFHNGMTSSIQTGLRVISKDAALMICLGDMPLLKSTDYDLLIKAFKQDGSSDKILVPWFKEKRANPVIFGTDYFEEIMTHTSPNGCAGVIKNHSEKVLNLKVDSERFIRDVDTPGDYKQLESNAE